MSQDLVLSVKGLATGFSKADGAAASPHALDGVSFDVQAGRVLGLVGESGSGKTLTALSLMRLLPEGALPLGGEISFEGRNLLALPERDMQAVRGRKLAMIFQEPATALSPVHDIGWHLDTVLRSTQQLPPGFFQRSRFARAKSRELLARVELPDPERLLDAYPHQLSAGMRRRILVALALAGRPRLLIADEPTTGLDAPIQSQLIDLFKRITREEGISALVISHDPEVVAEMASDVAVMYAGQIVETGPTRRVFAEPQHPYTLGLLESVRARRSIDFLPDSFARRPSARREAARPSCRFALRCPQRASAPDSHPRCSKDTPLLQPSTAQHQSRCFYPLLQPRDSLD